MDPLFVTVLAVAGIAVGVAGTTIVKTRTLRAFVASSKTLPRAPQPGEWIRFLVRFPELEAEIGDRAQVRAIYPCDNGLRYVVRVETKSGRTIYADFFAHEAWQFEVIR